MAQPQFDNPQSDLEAITRIGKAAGDQLRAKILMLLKEDSFAVSELCQILEVPQPALSHHLKILHQAGLLARRREANHLFYRRDNTGAPALKLALFDALDSLPADPALANGLDQVHRQRSRHCREFFADNASDIASLQTQIAEPSAYSDVVLDMARTARSEQVNARRVLELGPGEGTVLVGLAGIYTEVHGIDHSRAMLARTAQSAADFDNVELLEADFLEYQPAQAYDLIVAAMAVHHLPSPAAFFHHARRLLNQSGSLIVAELRRHDQQWASEICGDLWLGFEPAELTRWAVNAGLSACESQFLAQKNGFQIQIQRYSADQPSPFKEVK